MVLLLFRIDPLSGSIILLIIFKRVVLPHPFGPVKAKREVSAIVKETSFKSSLSPYAKLIFSIWQIPIYQIPILVGVATATSSEYDEAIIPALVIAR